jgi:hypothetical protein
MAEFAVPSNLEFAAITRRTRQRTRLALRAMKARFDGRAGLVLVTLNTGAVVGFPLSVLPGLEHAAPADLRRIEVQGGGYGLHVAKLDADISVPQLLADYVGSPVMNQAVARAKASRANGRAGGRPKGNKAA